MAGRIVGDGFIRPEVCTFINSGRVTSINAERGNLGTDKSVPYKKPAKPLQQTQYFNLRFAPAVPRSLCASVPLCEKIFLTNNERR
ncbi:MAG: hypothetical protein FWG87_01300 [Defluviitaleaceae bacterium]|nr:hypothetical protein [Defluviitaleaceae bacterium]